MKHFNYIYYFNLIFWSARNFLYILFRCAQAPIHLCICGACRPALRLIISAHPNIVIDSPFSHCVNFNIIYLTTTKNSRQQIKYTNLWPPLLAFFLCWSMDFSKFELYCNYGHVCVSAAQELNRISVSIWNFISWKIKYQKVFISTFFFHPIV